MLWSWSDVWKGVSEFSKHAAPVLGVAALFVSAATPLGLAFVVGAAVFGAINAVNNCSGGGSWLDCTMDIAGAVPVVGKIGVGAVKTARIASEQQILLQGVARNAPNRLPGITRQQAHRKVIDGDLERGAIGIGPHGWLANGDIAGAPGVFADRATLATGTEHWLACDVIKFSRCPKPAEPGRAVPSFFVGPLQPNVTRLPQPAVAHNYIGPLQPGVKRAQPPTVPHGFIGPITSDTVRQPAPDQGRNYSTKDGRLCNTRGGSCAS
jgi:hypothetical protein